MEQENNLQGLSYALSVGLDSKLSADSQRKFHSKREKPHKFQLENFPLLDERETEIELLQKDFPEDQDKEDEIKENTNTEFPPLLVENQVNINFPLRLLDEMKCLFISRKCLGPSPK